MKKFKIKDIRLKALYLCLLFLLLISLDNIKRRYMSNQPCIYNLPYTSLRFKTEGEALGVDELDLFSYKSTSILGLYPEEAYMGVHDGSARFNSGFFPKGAYEGLKVFTDKMVKEGAKTAVFIDPEYESQTDFINIMTLKKGSDFYDKNYKFIGNLAGLDSLAKDLYLLSYHPDTSEELKGIISLLEEAGYKNEPIRPKDFAFIQYLTGEAQVFVYSLISLSLVIVFILSAFSYTLFKARAFNLSKIYTANFIRSYINTEGQNLIFFALASLAILTLIHLSSILALSLIESFSFILLILVIYVITSLAGYKRLGGKNE